MHKRGFTLTELAIVLGVVGLLLGAIWSAASIVHFNYQVNQAEREILIISRNIRALYPGNAQFSSPGVENSTITQKWVNAGVFPPETLTGYSSAPFAVDPWGGQFVVFAQDPTTFVILVRYNHDVTRQCTQLFSKMPITAISDDGLVFTWVPETDMDTSPITDTTIAAGVCAGKAGYGFGFSQR